MDTSQSYKVLLNSGLYNIEQQLLNPVFTKQLSISIFSCRYFDTSELNKQYECRDIVKYLFHILSKIPTYTYLNRKKY